MNSDDYKKTPMGSVTEVPRDEAPATTTNPFRKAKLSQAKPYLVEKLSKDSMASTPLVSTADAEKGHLRGGQSAENMPRNSSVSEPGVVHLSPYATDIEAVVSPAESREPLNAGPTCRETQVWPGPKFWKKKAKEAKIQRSCTCLSRLSKRNRLLVKILIGVLIIGIAVGIGFGVSKPLGAWNHKS